MTTRTFGAVTLDVPDTYSDESVVVLKAPAPAPAVRMRAPAGEGRRPTLIMRRTPVSSDATLEELVAAEERTLQTAVPGMRFADTSTRTVSGHQAVVRELTLPVPEGTLRQVHVSLKAHGAYWVFVGTAIDDLEFTSARAGFLSIIDSARIG